MIHDIEEIGMRRAVVTAVMYGDQALCWVRQSVRFFMKGIYLSRVLSKKERTIHRSLRRTFNTKETGMVKVLGKNEFAIVNT